MADLLDRYRRRLSIVVEKARAAARSRGRPVTCRGLGCAGCCRGDIPVTEQEADRVLEAMDAAAWERVAAVDPSTRYDCPALDPATKACTVYDERPLLCRGYMTITPPTWCYPELAGDRNILHPNGPLRVVLQAWVELTGADDEKVRPLLHWMLEASDEVDETNPLAKEAS